MVIKSELPLPPEFDAKRADEIWRVPYQTRADQARMWAEQYDIPPAVADDEKTALILIDVQNTFCVPEFELYVGGHSGRGAVEDNQRLSAFIYRNLKNITHISATMDSHHPLHIFHALFLVDEDGNHPPANTMITHQDVKGGKWQVNEAAVKSVGIDPDYAQRFLQHYTETLADKEKFDLTVWPYHAMLGGIGHALVSTIEEAVFFHSIARQTQPQIKIKGRHVLTEHYSAVGPEVLEDHQKKVIARKDQMMLDLVKAFDKVLVAGQAKSHCLAWTVNDLLEQILDEDPALAQKVYLLEDCTTPIVIPDVVDYTEDAERAFQRFSEYGMHVVQATEGMKDWPS